MEKEPDGVKDVVHMKVLSNKMSHIISDIVTYIANEITQEELRSLRARSSYIRPWETIHQYYWKRQNRQYLEGYRITPYTITRF
ncbi:MAG: hypothetical protein WBZ36_09405 [Candidatus Nitrosopolaris sp.]